LNLHFLKQLAIVAFVLVSEVLNGSQLIPKELVSLDALLEIKAELVVVVSKMVFSHL
jgi:hypothetical protein